MTIAPRQRAWIGAGLGVALAAAAIAVASARAAAVLQDRRDEILAAVAKTIGWPVEAEGLEATWWPPSIVAHQVRVPDVSQYGPGNLAYADEARFDFDLLPLLRGRLVVTEVRLSAPVLRVVRGADGGWNLTRQVAVQPAERESSGGDWLAPRVIVDTVRVRNGRVSYRDRAIPGLGDLEVKAINLRLRQGGSGVTVDFNGQALGGPDENVDGRLQIPPPGQEPRTATLRVTASGLEASRVPEVVAVLRGRMPFGLSFGGALGASVQATMAAAWPPGSAAIDVAVDASSASVRAAGGWVDKRAGSPLDAEIGLHADGDALAVARARLRVAGAELHAEPDGPPGANGQPPLRFWLDGLNAQTLAQWVPAAAALSPRGALSIDGRIAPGAGPLGGELHVRGGALSIAADGRPIDASGGELRLVFSDDGERVLGSLRFDDVRTPEAGAGTVEVAVGGPMARPLTVTVAVRDASLRGAPVERLAIESTILDGEAEIRALRLDGLGGALLARGSVARGEGGVWDVDLEPEWEGIDVGSVLLALGEPAHARGTLRGRARLSTAGLDLASAAQNLVGDLEVSLADGEVADLNVAGATLDNLRGIPRLREAVERRARERVPDLLATTSEISLLSLRGAIAARVVTISDLALESEHYALEAQGRIAFDGGTDLAGTLVLSPSATQALVSDAGVVQLLSAPGGQVRIPVTVRGSYPRLTSAPTSDFVSRLAARAIVGPSADGGNDWLRRLFGGRERRDADTP